VSWTLDGETKNVRQSSFVMPPSGSDLPVVTTLTPTPSSPIESPVENVTFTGTTSSIPAGVSWSQDGTEKGEASGSGTGPWSFTWPIGPVVGGLADGDYLIGARARTGGGSYGPVHELTMKLNRSLPVQPTGFVAGKTGSSVDAEWRANRERDIEGYTVYRQKTAPVTGAVEQVNCGTVGVPVYITTSLTCTDASPLSASVGSVSFVDAAQSKVDGTNMLAANRPTGVVAGDVMIATVATSSGDLVTAPAGWTQIQNAATSGGGQGIRHASYYRIVPSGTEQASYTWTTPSNRSISALITAWRGVDTTAPINAFAQQNSGNTNGVTETAPTVTTTTANATVIRAFAHRGTSSTTLSTPPGTTSRAGIATALTASGQFSLTKATAGATGTATSTCTGNCTAQWAAHTIALKPALVLSANYWVKALDLTAAGTYREGDPSTPPVDAYAANTAPTAPAGLTGAPAADGSNVVSWTTQGTDPDVSATPPDSVAFYRVYRDGVRFDRTATGTDTSWTDARPGSGTHTYLLRAVDTHLTESPASASVTVTQP